MSIKSRKWGTVLLIAGAALCNFGLWQLVQPKLYRTTVRISLPKPEYIEPHTIPTEFEVIRSERVLGKVAEKLSLNDDWSRKHCIRNTFTVPETMEILNRHLELDSKFDTNSILFDVGFTSEDPVEATQIANALVQAYIDHRWNQMQERMQRSMKAHSDCLPEIEQRIRTLQEECDELKKAIAITNSNAHKPAVMLLESSSLRQMEASYPAKKHEYEIQQRLWERFQLLSRDHLRAILPATIFDFSLAAMVADLNHSQERLNALQKTYDSEDPRVLSLKDSIRQLDQQVEKKINDALKRLKEKVAQTKAKLDEVEKQLAEGIQPSSLYGGKNKELHELIHFRVSLTETITKATAPPDKTDFQIMKTAETPALPCTPNRPLGVAMLAGGLGLSAMGLRLLFPKPSVNT